LAILGQNKAFILRFLALPPSLSKNRSHATEGSDIYRQTNSALKKIRILLAT